MNLKFIEDVWISFLVLTYTIDPYCYSCWCWLLLDVIYHANTSFAGESMIVLHVDEFLLSFTTNVCIFANFKDRCDFISPNLRFIFRCARFEMWFWMSHYANSPLMLILDWISIICCILRWICTLILCRQLNTFIILFYGLDCVYFARFIVMLILVQLNSALILILLIFRCDLREVFDCSFCKPIWFLNVYSFRCITRCI